MNFILKLSCFSLLLAAVAAQHPKPCKSPALMSGGHTVLVGEGMTATGTISYDAYAQRVRVRQMGMVGNGTYISDELMLFSENTYYMIDWTRYTCTKWKLDGKFFPMRVPEDANLMGQVIMGSSSSWGMGVLVNTWYGSLPGNGMYSHVFTETGCIPVSFTTYTPTDGWVTLSTFNWVVGLSNPMDFIPPAFCHKAQLQETEQPHTFFTALKALTHQSNLE